MHKALKISPGDRPEKKTLERESLVFLKRLLSNPRALGALVPSSRALARFICQHLNYHPQDFIIELGAGTGRLTRAILEAGIPASRLIIVEMDPELARYLRYHFPEVHLIEGDAAKLNEFLPPEAQGNIRTVVSGIPMVNLAKSTQRAIMETSFQLLTPEGCFIQFTYGLFSPIPFQGFGLRGKRLGHVFQNFPPATIWRYTRAENFLSDFC